MSTRFFKRIQIIPGVTINLSKRGVSLSLGPRGAKVTANKSGIRKTFGIPGTGLFSTSYQKYNTKKAVKPGHNKAEIIYTPNWYLPGIISLYYRNRASLIVNIILLLFLGLMSFLLYHAALQILPAISALLLMILIPAVIVGLISPAAISQPNRNAVLEIGMVYFILFTSIILLPQFII